MLFNDALTALVMKRACMWERQLTAFFENFFFLIVLEFNAILTAKVISWQSVTHLCLSWLSYTNTETTFLFKATDCFSHIHQR